MSIHMSESGPTAFHRSGTVSLSLSLVTTTTLAYRTVLSEQRVSLPSDDRHGKLLMLSIG